MNDLINFLKQVEADGMIKETEYLSFDISIINDISGLAETVLITTDGTCNWYNIDVLENNGFHVFPIEKDKFGWLVGGISTRKGIIAYG